MVGGFFLALAARAAEERTPAAASTATTEHEGIATRVGTLNFHGAFDLYFGHNFNGSSAYESTADGALGRGTPAAQNTYRAFDLYSHQFGINLLELNAELEGKEADLNVDFDYGEAGDLIHRLASTGEFDEVSKYLGQAYVTYHPTAVSGLRISAGKMLSQFGMESFRAQENPNYSHVFVYSLGGVPYWGVGLKVSYQIIPGTLLAAASVTNGWNSFYDLNGGKTYGVRLGFMPFEGLQLYYNGAFGPEQVGTTAATRSVHDVGFAYSSGPEFSLLGDITVGSGNSELLSVGTMGPANWSGAWAAVKMGFSGWYFAPRVEYLRDGGGALSHVDQKLVAETLTIGLLLTETLQARLEFRHDQSDNAPFVDKDGSPTNAQNTVLVAALYSF